MFSLYTGAAEYNNPVKDIYGRDRLFSRINIFDPVVSARISEEGFTPHYPDGKKFAACISHDIDFLFVREGFFSKGLNATKNLVKGQFSFCNYYLKALIKKQVFPDLGLKRLVELNKQFNIHSTYFFLALKEGEPDFNYSLESVRREIEIVTKNGNEIGLHGGHEAYNNLDKLKSEKEYLEQTLGSTVKGYRNHFLRFEVPTTWSNLQKAGFQYDSTLAYADCIGFRNGMCYPFIPYNVNTRQFLDIIEVPLIVMDASIFYYMRMNADDAYKLCFELVQKVRKYGGVFTILWHNNFLNAEYGKLYQQLLTLLSKEKAWFATSSEVVNWWKNEGLLDKSTNIIKDLLQNRGLQYTPEYLEKGQF